MSTPAAPKPALPWYAGVTGYQWLVLVIASPAGSSTSSKARSSISPASSCWSTCSVASSRRPGVAVRRFIPGVFLVGGTFGGILFGSLADRFGRKPIMAATILCYSIFLGPDLLRQRAMAGGRAAVSRGHGRGRRMVGRRVAGGRSVPARAPRAPRESSTPRACWAPGWRALAGLWVAENWRLAYVVGVGPALLVLWIRASVHEPESWRSAEAAGRRGSLVELLSDSRWMARALLGLGLAAVGLGTFWGVVVAGQDLTSECCCAMASTRPMPRPAAKFAYGIVQTAGGGLGLLAFGPLAERFGRRPAFAIMQIAALVIVPVTCWLPQTYGQMLAILPVFGFFTLGIHAGFAIYFPELFPARLRATGSGFCFNGGRLVAASVLVFSGWLKAQPGMDLRLAVSLLSGLFLFGILVVWFLPETKDQPLPE